MISNSAHPFLSLLTSLILFFGFYEIGKFAVSKFSLKSLIQNVSSCEFQYTSIGIVIISLILFPLVAFTNSAKFILIIFSIILFVFGIKFLKSIKQIFLNFKIEKKDLFFYVFILIVSLYFLLALSPLTAADVLDYHSGVALNILRFDRYILLPEWFTGLQAGHGETLISLGFSVGAEQFGSLIQFSSILCISGIIIKFSENQRDLWSKYFLVVTVLTCPILIFLLSGNKPQIFYSSLLFFAFALNFVKLKNKKEILISYLIINILICLCVMGKFSFNLSGGLVWLFSTLNFINKENYRRLIIIPISVFAFLFLPFIYWKYINLGGNFFTYLYSPFPLHLPGYETFLNHNRGSQEIPLPNFLFYTSMSRLTEFLALSPIYFIILIFFIKQKKNISIILLMVLAFVLISNLYASPSARYYLDVILWLTIGVTFLKNFKINNILKILFFPQVLMTVVILIYSVYNFLPGSFSKKLYRDVKNNYAYMYSGFEWLNEIVPDNSKILIINRPIANYKEFAVSGNFNYFTNKDEAIYYKNLIKKYDLELIAYFGNKADLMHLKNCALELFKKKENVGFHATRNPFNKGSYYNGYIYHFDNNKLPNC